MLCCNFNSIGCCRRTKNLSFLAQASKCFFRFSLVKRRLAHLCVHCEFVQHCDSESVCSLTWNLIYLKGEQKLLRNVAFYNCTLYCRLLNLNIKICSSGSRGVVGAVITLKIKFAEKGSGVSSCQPTIQLSWSRKILWSVCINAHQYII
jgi:hypothetical protein